MKKSILLIAFLAASIIGFSQAKKDTVVSTEPKMYIILLSGPELDYLRNFILNGDIYSDKGRQVYLDKLFSKLYEMPAIADTAQKKK